MNPDERHQQYIKELVANNIKTATRMARARFTLIDRTVAYEFKVYMQIWQDDDWDYNYFKSYCKKLALDAVVLNNNSYKAMSDNLYEALAAEMPGSEITIVINNGDIGLTTKYKN